MSVRPEVRLLHTSDLHLGSDIGVTGTAWHGVHCACPLVAVARLAAQESCDLLLIVGDLFDSNRVPDVVVRSALDVLKDLPIPTVIVPGNHDAYDETSVYKRHDFEHRADHIHVVNREDGKMVRLDPLSTTVWARPVVVHDSAHRPLVNAPPNPGDGWYVVAAHGQYTGRQRYAGTPPSSPISPEELAQIDANYIALGHEDLISSVGSNATPTWYSGAPHAAGDPRAALLVTLGSEHGVRVEVRDVPRVEIACARTAIAP